MKAPDLVMMDAITVGDWVQRLEQGWQWCAAGNTMPTRPDMRNQDLDEHELGPRSDERLSDHNTKHLCLTLNLG